MPFIPSDPYKLQSNSTTGSRWLIARWRIVKKRTSGSTSTCATSWPAVDQVDAEVASMLDKWRSVEEGGKSLQDLLDEQVRFVRIAYMRARGLTSVQQDQLVELQEAIGTSLEYFQELEHATRLLNYPSESLVLQNRLSLYSRTRGHLHRIPQVPCKL